MPPNERFRNCIHFEKIDLRVHMPDGPFDMILCRDSVFTDFSTEKQAEVLSRLNDDLRPGGYLILGSYETLPDEVDFHRLEPAFAIYQKEPNREDLSTTGPGPTR